MNLGMLSEKDQKNVRAIAEFANRMTAKYGFNFTDDDGNTYNWMTGLCRDLYGRDWEEYMEKKGILVPDEEAVQRSQEWEESLPEWVRTIDDEENDTEKMIVFEEDLGEKK